MQAITRSRNNSLSSQGAPLARALSGTDCDNAGERTGKSTLCRRSPDVEITHFRSRASLCATGNCCVWHMARQVSLQCAGDPWKQKELTFVLGSATRVCCVRYWCESTGLQGGRYMSCRRSQDVQITHFCSRQRRSRVLCMALT